MSTVLLPGPPRPPLPDRLAPDGLAPDRLTAALLDGFVTRDLAAACRGAAQGCGAADGAAFGLVAVTIQHFTRAGLVAMSAAARAWALALLSGAVGAVGRVACAVGLLCAAAPAVVLLSSDVWLRPGNLVGLLAPQVVWALLAAIVMSRAGAHSESGAPRPASAGA